MKFPIFKPKIEGVSKKFDLTDPLERKAYFELKAGKEIEKLRDYVENHSFIAYLLGKKNSGKGTYSKMLAEVVNPRRIEHLSVGDMVRSIEKDFRVAGKKERIMGFLEKNYRGSMPLKEAILAFEKRDTKTLLPTELILSLIKLEVSKKEKKTLFIDGFPRNLDQISFSLFFRDLIGYRDDPDVFILIDVPESVIDERIKYRVICPICQTSRNLKLLPTKNVFFDKEKKEFYLVCDNPHCKGARMVKKEGDELGIEPIRQRLAMDEELMKKALSLYGIPKILLRNSIPVKEASKCVDDYEITPEYVFKWNPKTDKVEITKKPWRIIDDEGNLSYSLLPPPVVVSLIKQLVETLLT